MKERKECNGRLIVCSRWMDEWMIVPVWMRGCMGIWDSGFMRWVCG